MSLGYVECHGLSGAIIAADLMLKTADVQLESIQNSKGYGWITLIVQGDLSAVSVAVESVKSSLPGVYVTSVVIGNPAQGLQNLGMTDVGDSPSNAPEASRQEKEEFVESKPTTENDELLDSEIKAVSDQETSLITPKEEQKEILEKNDNDEVTCNLCGDPKCQRKLGEPHKKCIHFQELNKKQKKDRGTKDHE